MRSLTCFLLLGIAASFNTFATGITPQKTPDISWQKNATASHCIGNACFKLEEKKPDMFDRLNKTERRQIMNPNSPYDQDNSENRKSFTFRLHGN